MLLAEGRTAVKIGSSKPFKARRARQGAEAEGAGRRTSRREVAQLRSPLRFVPGAAPLRLGDEAYRGTLLVHKRGGG